MYKLWQPSCWLNSYRKYNDIIKDCHILFLKSESMHTMVGFQQLLRAHKVRDGLVLGCGKFSEKQGIKESNSWRPLNGEHCSSWTCPELVPQPSWRTAVVLGVNVKPKLKPLVLIKEPTAALAVLDEQHLALVRHLFEWLSSVLIAAIYKDCSLFRRLPPSLSFSIQSMEGECLWIKFLL